jgi:ABC-type oligopeptide transport system substrate-binding subunit/class 3 adenylate cyclase
MPVTDQEQIAHLKQAIAELQTQKAEWGSAVVEASLRAMQKQLADLEGRSGIHQQQRKLATLLYMDVVGSTQFSQHLEPDEVLEIMDAALQRLADPVAAHGGHVARFQGDGFKAVFGLPLAREDDPEQAVRAGLEIQEKAQEIAKEWEELYHLPGFQVRVGINTGLVAAGGETEAGDTIMGRAVNLAARLENAAPPGGLLISHHTYRHVRGMFDVELANPVQAKGFKEPVPVYLVRRAKPRAFRLPTRGVEGVETRMVGRESELKALQDALLTASEEGEGQVVTIVGEAGVGKSRLLYEFQNWVELLPQTSYIFHGRARQETQHLPFALLRDIFSFLNQVPEYDQGHEASPVEEAEFTDEYASRILNLIGQWLGFSISEHSGEDAVSAKQLRDAGVFYLKDYFKHLCEQAPVLIFLEDIHWADDSSLDAIDKLGELAREIPLLVVCLSRMRLFENRPFWGEGQQYHYRMELEPLTRRESRQLVQEILKRVDQVPLDLRERIVTGSEGNPYYIEESVKVFIDEGVIIKGEEQWEIVPERLINVNIPATLTGILQARLDSLHPGERTMLQLASVIGRIFWDEAIEYIHAPQEGELPVEAVTEVLQVLRRKEIIYQRETSIFPNTQEFIFKHTLLREVAYDSLPKRVRRKYHSLAADWLIACCGDIKNQCQGMIADHLELAGQMDRSISFLIQAGDQARSLYALTEAERYYKKAVEALAQSGDQEMTARTLLKLGLVYTAAFKPKEANLVNKQAFGIWEPLRQSRAISSEAPQGAILRFAAESPSTIDPGLIHDDVSVFFATQLFEGLVRIGSDFNILPAVAEKWEISDNGRMYTFFLRRNARWSDGTVVTAMDFEFAWKRNLDPVLKSPLAHLLFVIENANAYGRGGLREPEQIGVTAPNESILEVRLDNPSAYLPYLLAQPIAYPQPRWVIERHGADWTSAGNMISNGAYYLSDWEAGRRFVLKRNPHYLGKTPHSGNIDVVEFLLFPDYQSALFAYASGSVDAVSMFNADPAMVAQARFSHGEELVRIPHPTTFYLCFRVDKPPFADVRVRKAFVKSIDREKLVDHAFPGQRQAATGGFVPPGMPGHSPGIGLHYNPKQARELLAQAGYPNGEGFPSVGWFHALGGERIIDFLRQSWQENLGLHLSSKSLEWGKFLEKSSDPGNLMLYGWSADYPDPESMLRTTFHSTEGDNDPRWHNQRFDMLIEEAGRTPDHQKRMKLYQEADLILVSEETAIMPLTYGQGRMLIKPWITLPASLSIQMLIENFILRK